MRTVTCAAIMLLAMGLCAGAQSMPTNAPVNKPHLITEYGIPSLEKKISLDLIEAMDVVDLIKFLCVKAELNVIVGREVTGTSKLVLKDVTLGDALEIILAANDLAYEIKGNIIKIMTDKNYRDLYGEGFYERKQAKVIALKYATPSKVALMLAEIKSSIGKIVSDDGTGHIVLIDTPAKIREMEALIQKSEMPTIQRVLPTVTTNLVLQYALVEDVEKQISPLLTKDVGTIQKHVPSKTLIITDLPSSMPKICNVVAVFDRAPKQVFIEAKIVQVALSDTFSMGVNWDHIFQGLDPRFSLQSVSKSSPPLGLDISKTAGAGGSVTYHTIAAGGDLNVVVQALATVGKTRLLQNPHIATLDGQEAMIKAITTEPYSELQYESGSSNIVGKTYKFVDVGVTLGVTPHINELGFITCDIKPEVSSVERWYDRDILDSEGNSGVPVVKKSFAETTVSVKDGVTIIIAGMIEQEEVKDRTQVPLLGSIPLLGALFRSDYRRTKNTETVILLTPRIVTGAKFFERAKDMKKPMKADGITDAGLVGSDLTP